MVTYALRTNKQIEEEVKGEKQHSRIVHNWKMSLRDAGPQGARVGFGAGGGLSPCLPA